MTPLYDYGTYRHSRPSPPSPRTPTTSALAKSPLLTRISSSPAHTMAPYASLTPAQANVNSSWAQPRRGLVLVPCLSNKCSCIHRVLSPCQLQGPSFAYGISSRVGGVSAPCRTTRRRSRRSLSTPTRRGY